MPMRVDRPHRQERVRGMRVLWGDLQRQQDHPGHRIPHVKGKEEEGHAGIYNEPCLKKNINRRSFVKLFGRQISVFFCVSFLNVILHVLPPQTQKAVSEGGYLSKFSLSVRHRTRRSRSIPEARGCMADRVIDLDLWAEGNAEKLPAITMTPQGLRLEGSIAEFDRLLLILGGWMKP